MAGNQNNAGFIGYDILGVNLKELKYKSSILISLAVKHETGLVKSKRPSYILLGIAAQQLRFA
jgi:hypothetical protein